MSIKPSNTFSLFFPKGLIIVFAISTSSPDLVAAIAKMNPPRKRMMVGSAKHAMIPTESSSCPYSPSLPCRNLNEELLTQNSNTKIIVTLVAQAGIASVNQSSTAIMKTAITRCCTTVSPSIPKLSMGRFQTISVMIAVTANINIFFLLKSPVRVFLTFSAICLSL